MSSTGSRSVRLAELIAALSLATDLGLGEPMEHVLRSCLISMRLGERIGLTDAERGEVYYVSLLAWVGCMSDSTEMSALFGDDIAWRADTVRVADSPLALQWFFLRRAGSSAPPLKRARLKGQVLVTGSRVLTQSMAANCQLTGQLAERLGLGETIQRSLQQVFARWDGQGMPTGVGRDDIALSARIMQVADIAEIFHREHGVQAAVEAVVKRGGSSLDPALVDEFRRLAQHVLPTMGQESSWDEVIAGEPVVRAPLTEAQLDIALEAIADFTDLKSIFFSGHSRGVANLAADAARHAGFPGRDVVVLRRAGLVHDLGRSGVPNTIWDKQGPLTFLEWERVRLHPYYTERVLARIPALSRVAGIAVTHHERLDGSGYHRGLSGGAIGPSARLLAAADAYQAMTQERAYRPALSADQAAAELRAEVRAGRLAGDAVEAVLHAAGQQTRRRPGAVAGLTVREVQVLSLLARGVSNRNIASSLGISAKTVGNHVEHIYSKIGVSTRPATTLFAMQHGLLDDAEPLQR
jgi:HD-GYP domain-containing protein (c-di-GMP phosphodiesterase class II)